MTFPVHEGIGTHYYSTYTTQATPEIPAGYVVGEILTAFVVTDYSRVISAPAEWGEPVASHLYTNNIAVSIYQKTAESGEPNPIFTVDTGYEAMVAVIFRGSGVSSLSAAQPTNINSDTYEFPAFGNASVDSVVYRVLAVANGQEYNLVMPGTLLFDENSGGASSSNVRLAISSSNVAQGDLIPIAEATANTAELALMFTLVMGGALPDRRIDDVDTDNALVAGQTNILVNTVGLDASSTIQQVTFGGIDLPISDWNNGKPFVSVPLHINLKPNENYELVVTDDTGSVSIADISLGVADGWEFVFYDDSDPGTNDVGFLSSSLADLGITIASGDAWYIESFNGMLVKTDGSAEIDEGLQPTGDYKVWDESALSFSSVSSYSYPLDGAVNSPATGVPLIIGEAKQSRTLSVDTSQIADADGLGEFSYQWRENGADIPAANATTFTPGLSQVGSTISVAISFRDGNNFLETVVSNPTAAIAPSITVTLSGSLKNSNGTTPDDVNGLELRIFANAQDLQSNSNVLTQLSTNLVLGDFSASTDAVEAGFYYFRLTNPADYTRFSYGRIEAA